MTTDQADAWRIAHGKQPVFDPKNPPVGLMLCEQAGL
jgi:hypothetical protein